ncbi:MAG TPA: DUF4097 family beta strand repeat-containing protein [Terriglobales bacterium]|nr:DUF4097 family beta strand repeat-containing protein [Terriglobales bacterium]
MTRIYKFAAAALLTAGAPILARAQQNEPRFYREGNAWVEEVSGTLGAAHNLRVDIAVGSIHVDGSNDSSITYTLKDRAYTGSEEAARRQLSALHATARLQGDTAVIESQGFSGGKMGGEVWVHVPRTLEMARVTTRGGAITVNNLGGRLVAETAGGGINLSGLGGVSDATTMGGDIMVDTATADLRLHTNGGRIRVNSASSRLTADTLGGDLFVGSARGPVTLETNGGSIHVSRTESDLKAETAGGNIEAGDVGGSAVLETAGGTIRLNSARGAVHAETASGAIHLGRVQGGVRAETANGGITAEFAGSRLVDSTLETAVGDITVYIPSNLACSVRAAVEMASGHSIRSDFPEVKVTSPPRDEEYGPREQSASGPINGGGPLLRLRTSMGDIQILRVAAH